MEGIWGGTQRCSGDLHAANNGHTGEDPLLVCLLQTTNFLSLGQADNTRINKQQLMFPCL